MHRTGRSARAGKGGAGLLLLCEYEAPFLDLLQGLPVAAMSEADRFWAPPAPARNAELASSGGSTEAGEGLESLGEQAYQSWLGFYRGLCKPLRWSNEDLVAKANGFAASLG